MAKKGINPFAVGLGAALGVAGAVFLSKKENRAKAAKAIKNAGATGGSWLSDALKVVNDVAGDMDALSRQKELDNEKKRRAPKKRTR